MTAGDPLAVRPQNKALAVATAAGVGALAVGGFMLSFAALRELAQREFAIADELSFIYPLVIDGFIVIATAAAFTMKARGPQVTWYPWAALGVFGALSVLGNAAHAIDNPTATFPGWVSAAGASVPAVALLIASHLLVMMIDGKKQTRSRPQAKRPAPGRVSVRSAETEELTVSPVEATGETPEFRLHAVDMPPKATPLEDHVASALAAGLPVNAAMVAEFEGVSERTGRRRLSDLRGRRPELFDGALPSEEAAR